MFKKKSTPLQTSLTQKPNEYPPGSFLRTEKGLFYVFNDTKRYRFITYRVLESWAPQRIWEASETDEAVQKLNIFAKMRFRNGSLLYYHQDGKMYLVSKNKLRHVPNPGAYGLKDAVWINEDEFNLHEIGKPLWQHQDNSLPSTSLKDNS